MNLVGKIFVVVIFVFSLVLMSLVMAVYMTHQNWRDVVMLPAEQARGNRPLGLKFQLEKANRDKKEIETQRDKLEVQYNAELKQKQMALTALENEYAVVKKERDSLQRGQAEKEKMLSLMSAAVDATQKNSTDFRKKQEELAEEQLKIQQETDRHFKEIVRLTDELNSGASDKQLLEKRLTDLSKDLARAKKLLQLNDIKEDDGLKQPPKLAGVVLSVNTKGLIVISLGSDMGLRKGHTLEVYRTTGGQAVYVGRVEVMSVEPNRSVCKIDPNFQNSQVRENDSVRSKFE